jgi:hypothetical protein
MSKFPNETMTINGPDGWTIELDIRERQKEAGEPAIVVGPNGERGTYDAAFLYEECDGVALPENVARWIDLQHSAVDSFLY